MPSDQDENRTVGGQRGKPAWQPPGPGTFNVSSFEDDELADSAYPAPTLSQHQLQLEESPDLFEDEQFEDEQFTDELQGEQLIYDALSTDDLNAPETEGDLLRWNRPAPFFSKETLLTFWRQFAPILIPLPMAALIFLLTLSSTLPGTFIPLWAMVTVLLTLLAVQGILIYFAGSNDTLLAVYAAGGYALFVVTGVYASFGLLAALVIFGALVAGAALLARRGLHPTRMGYVDIVTVFGKYKQTLVPGLNLLLPWEKVVCSLNIQEITWQTPKMEIPTAREHKVELSATISYQLVPEDAFLVASTFRDWEKHLHALCQTTIQSVVNELTLGDFITWNPDHYHDPTSDQEAAAFNPATPTRWDRICTGLERRIQDQVASQGIQINRVRILDLTPLPATPPAPAIQAQNNQGGTTQMMQENVPAAPAPAPALKAAPVKEAIPLVATPAPPQVPAATAKAPKAPRTAKRPSVEILVDTYNLVRQNVITEPRLILELADHFESLANDPAASKKIEFDAERAAATLRKRAQSLQEMQDAQ